MEEREILYLPVYEDFFLSEARYALLYAGAGSGKSVAAAQKMLLRAMQDPGARVLYVRKFRSTLRRSVWALLCQLIAEAGLDERVEAYVSTLTLRFPNGAEILCTGVDDPEKLKSIQGISSVWVEEATELKEADFRQLELRVRGETPGYKQFVLTFNPVDTGSWIYGRFFRCEMRVASCENREVGEEEHSDISQLASGNSSDIFKLRTTQADNPELDGAYRHYLEEQLRADENLFRIYSLGLWGQVRRGGAFYKKFSVARHVAEITTGFAVAALGAPLNRVEVGITYANSGLGRKFLKFVGRASGLIYVGPRHGTQSLAPPDAVRVAPPVRILLR